MIDFEKKVQALKSFFSNHFPRRAGAIALDHFDDSFRNTGFTDRGIEKWKPVIDKKGKPKQRPLVQSGRLRRSGHAKEDATGVSIIYDAPYAAVHNEGLKVEATQNVSSHTRKRGKNRSSVKAHTRKVSFTMPKRQFIGPSHEMDQKIEKMITDELDNIL